MKHRDLRKAMPEISSLHLGSFIYYARKIFEKTNISYPVIPTRTCAYQDVRNVSFSL